MPESGRFYWCVTLLLFTGLLLPLAEVFAFSPEAIEILKISPSDGVAVIRTPGKPPRPVKVGDQIDAHKKVIEIAEELLVLRETIEGKEAAIILRARDGRQSVQRVSDMTEERRALYLPIPHKEFTERDR